MVVGHCPGHRRLHRAALPLRRPGVRAVLLRWFHKPGVRLQSRLHARDRALSPHVALGPVRGAGAALRRVAHPSERRADHARRDPLVPGAGGARDPGLALLGRAGEGVRRAAAYAAAQRSQRRSEQDPLHRDAHEGPRLELADGAAAFGLHRRARACAVARDRGREALRRGAHTAHLRAHARHDGGATDPRRGVHLHQGQLR